MKVSRVQGRGGQEGQKSRDGRDRQVCVCGGGRLKVPAAVINAGGHQEPKIGSCVCGRQCSGHNFKDWS